MSRTRILNLGVDKVTMAEALERCLAFLGGSETHTVFTPNAEIGYNAYRNPELAALLNDADMVIADGVGVVMASRILGDPVPEKVGGTDLSTLLVETLSEKGRGRIYLLGARAEVVAEAARRLKERYPGITVAGYHDGYFGPDQDAAVARLVREASADVLFVGMGSPRQERFIHQYRHELGVKLALGIGGTIDVWAGHAARAPEWMIKAKLEWLFRIVKLGRVRRSLPPLLKFGFAVIGQRLRGK